VSANDSVNQKAIITVEDTGEGLVSIEVKMDPPVKGDAKATPAMFTAFRMMELFSEDQKDNGRFVE